MPVRYYKYDKPFVLQRYAHKAAVRRFGSATR